MSSFTVSLECLVRQFTFNSTKTFSERIDDALPFIFNFDFPCWNNEYKKVLERKIVMHYLEKEIAYDSVELWRLYMQERLNLIMPYYNKLYETTVKDYDYTKSIDVSTSNNTLQNGGINSSNEQSSTGSNVVSGGNNDTVTNYDYPQINEESGDTYASNKNITDSTISNTTNTSGHDIVTQDTTNHNSVANNSNTNGNNIPIADLILKYRDTLLNIDSLIVNQLGDLFHGTYKLMY